MNISLKQKILLGVFLAALVVVGLREYGRPTETDRVFALTFATKLAVIEQSSRSVETTSRVTLLNTVLSYHGTMLEAIYESPMAYDAADITILKPDGSIDLTAIAVAESRLEAILNWSFIPGFPIGD